jgi:RNA polymerase-associated protein RTF1
MERLMQMSEIEREEILSQRLEEKQRLKDKRMISQMVKDQRGTEGESVSKAAKRSFICFASHSWSVRLMPTTGQHMMRGATKEKSRKLDELKARRRAKDEKQRVCAVASISALC